MKKTFWSLAALMLMAAPMMTSCSNDVDEVAPVEEVKSNVVTINIAPPAPETRVAVDGSLKITGWEDGANADEVTLYKMAYTGGGAEGTPASTLTGAGVTFTCIDAANGTFSGDLGENNIDDYTLAVYGATAKLEDINGSNYVVLLPKTMCAEELKDVVIMAAMKDNEGKYTMEVVNNVLKIQNGTAADVVVAWSQEQKYYEGNIHFFTPLSGWIFDDVAYDWIWTGAKVYPGTLPNYTGWEKAEKFTLKAGVDSYVNMGLCGNSYEKWGLAKEDGTEILEKKQMTGRANGVKGKLYNAGTVGAAATVDVTSITLDQTSVDLEVGDYVTLIETVGPDNATDKTVTWSSNREDIATVVDGVVTAVGAGTAIITATANDGSGVSESCTVHVIGSAVFAKDSWSETGSGLEADNGEIFITLSKSTGYFQINTNSRTGVVSSIGTATGGTENGDKMTISIIPSQEYTVKCGSYTALSGGNTWTLTLTDSGWVDEGSNVILPKNITQNITVTY